MTKFTQYPEIIIDKTIYDNKNIKVINLGDDFIELNFDHPNLGSVSEIFKKSNNSDKYSLKFIYPRELQDEDEIHIAKDYYNLFLLESWETYLEYFNPEDGWYLISRNFDMDEE